MTRKTRRIAASMLGLGLGVTALAPALADPGLPGRVIDFGDTDRIIDNDLPVILGDVEHGLGAAPGLLGGLLGPAGSGGLLGALLGGVDELRDAPVVGGGSVGEGSYVGRGVLGGDDGVATPGGLGGLLHLGSLNSILAGLL